jgi:hypothetical protein
VANRRIRRARRRHDHHASSEPVVATCIGPLGSDAVSWSAAAFSEDECAGTNVDYPSPVTFIIDLSEPRVNQQRFERRTSRKRVDQSRLNHDDDNHHHCCCRICGRRSSVTVASHKDGDQEIEAAAKIREKAARQDAERRAQGGSHGGQAREAGGARCDQIEENRREEERAEPSDTVAVSRDGSDGRTQRRTRQQLHRHQRCCSAGSMPLIKKRPTATARRNRPAASDEDAHHPSGPAWPWIATAGCSFLISAGDPPRAHTHITTATATPCVFESVDSDSRQTPMCVTEAAGKRCALTPTPSPTQNKHATLFNINLPIIIVFVSPLCFE